MSRKIIIHYVSGHRLELKGEHVPPFFDNYKEAIKEGNTHFYSEAKDKILIQIDKVTFIQETDIEDEKDNRT